MQRISALLLGAILVVLWAVLGSTARADHVKIERAVLIAGGIEREVSLPHTLGPLDFDPDGSIVTYRLTFDMPSAKDGLQAIYIVRLEQSIQADVAA